MARKSPVVTETEIQEAIRRFRERGGLIHKLPDEPEPVRNLVGARWGVYEPVMDQFRVVSPGE